MAILATNVGKLPIVQKLARGQNIIALSTDNPNVPDNTAPLDALIAAQAALTAASAAYEQHCQEGKSLLQARNNALAAWEAALSALGSFTESATGGDAEKILTTGFDVKAPRSAPEPVAQIEEVRVIFTGSPGYSEVRWKRAANADAYVIERSPDPITDTSWATVATVSEPKFIGNGTIPGQPYWFRVRGVNRLGPGPWSAPALRPVM